MKNKVILLAFTCFCFSFSSCSTLKGIIAEPTALESILAVKEVMSSSQVRALNKLRKLNKNGVESLIPAEVNTILNTMGKLGIGGEMDQIKSSIESASSVVLKEGTFIMEDAIKQVDVGDAVAIVVGGEDAATAVLRQAMYKTVKQRYSEKIDVELGKSEIKQYWPTATSAYNVFAKKKIDSDLSGFLAERAVDAVFLAMGKEEKEIRKKPADLGKAVVTKVFDYYSKKNKR